MGVAVDPLAGTGVRTAAVAAAAAAGAGGGTGVGAGIGVGVGFETGVEDFPSATGGAGDCECSSDLTAVGVALEPFCRASSSFSSSICF